MQMRFGVQWRGLFHGTVRQRDLQSELCLCTHHLNLRSGVRTKLHARIVLWQARGLSLGMLSRRHVRGADGMQLVSAKSVLGVSLLSTCSLWCQACMLPEVAAFEDVQSGSGVATQPAESVEAAAREEEDARAPEGGSEPPVPEPSVDAGSVAAPPRPVDAGAPTVKKPDDACSVNNGGCDTSPLATCSAGTTAAPSCTCPAGSSGDGRGSDGCALDAPVIGPCGKFVCDEHSVKDPSTGLIWQRAVPAVYTGCQSRYVSNQGTAGNACNWQEAMGYCAQLSLQNSRWRLPTKDELLTIVDTSRTEPAIDLTAFPGTASEAFWSATPSTEDRSSSWSEGAWYVLFQNGTPYEGFDATSVRVRCVR